MSRTNASRCRSLGLAACRCLGICDLSTWQSVILESSTRHITDELHTSEVDYVASFGSLRRREFETVRGCARMALGRLGHLRGAMVPAAGGAPQWPANVVGSMTHTQGYYAAAVASNRLVESIGIDAEPNQPLPLGVTDLVLTKAESKHLERLSMQRSDIAWDRLVFSAKESTYKAWYPVTSRWLDFHDVRVVLTISGGWTVSLLESTWDSKGAALLARFHGRWARHGPYLVTGVLATPVEGSIS